MNLRYGCQDDPRSRNPEPTFILQGAEPSAGSIMYGSCGNCSHSIEKLSKTRSSSGVCDARHHASGSGLSGQKVFSSYFPKGAPPTRVKPTTTRRSYSARSTKEIFDAPKECSCAQATMCIWYNLTQFFAKAPTTKVCPWPPPIKPQIPSPKVYSNVSSAPSPNPITQCNRIE